MSGPWHHFIYRQSYSWCVWRKSVLSNILVGLSSPLWLLKSGRADVSHRYLPLEITVFISLSHEFFTVLTTQGQSTTWFLASVLLGDNYPSLQNPGVVISFIMWFINVIPSYKNSNLNWVGIINNENLIHSDLKYINYYYIAKNYKRGE